MTAETRKDRQLFEDERKRTLTDMYYALVQSGLSPDEAAERVWEAQRVRYGLSRRGVIRKIRGYK